jgi:PTH1 family peptidyl-tRNA hydrolase
MNVVGRDIIRCLGNSRDFLRLRIGVGHPGDSRQVVGYVLNKPHRQDNDKIRAEQPELLREKYGKNSP